MSLPLHPRAWSIPVRIFIACLLVSFAILCIGELDSYRARGMERNFTTGLQSCAEDSQGSSELIACTHEIVRSALENRTASELLNDVSSRSMPKPYGDCHSVAHVIGQETYRVDPNLEHALSRCSNQCFGGCLHGALGEVMVERLGIRVDEVDIAHMDTEQIEAVAGKFCLGIANTELCHGIGHILYSLTGNFKAATQSCGSIATGEMLDQCVTGVYMQGIGGVPNSLVLSESVPSLADVPDDDYGYPCNTIAPDEKRYRHPCFKYLPPYQEILFARKNITERAEKLRIATQACETFGMPERAYCFEGIGRFLPFYVEQTGTTTEGLVSICAELPNETDRESCAHGHVRILRSYGRPGTALTYCTAIRSETLQDSCFYSFFSYDGLDVAPSENACMHADAKELCISKFAQYTQELPAIRKSGRYSY